jgi:hypothetical protein
MKDGVSAKLVLLRDKKCTVTLCRQDSLVESALFYGTAKECNDFVNGLLRFVRVVNYRVEENDGQ